MRRIPTIILLCITILTVNFFKKFSYANFFEIVGSAVRDEGSISVYFCPRQDCLEIFLNILSSAQSVECALYTVSPEVITAIQQVPQHTILIDYKTYQRLSEKVTDIIPVYSEGIMHNKFCIINKSILITGSWNPTLADSFKNNNNMLIIHSQKISNNYEEKFKQLLLRNTQRYSPKIKHKIILSNALVENYFCPEDNCSRILIEKINSATSTIYFMTFSFTEDSVGDALLKKNSAGIIISGIFDRQQLSNFSEYERLLNAGIDVSADSNKYLMHHKVFIIDNSTVITGSFNPTQNGNTKNDENILIIHSREIASRYVEEFLNLKADN
ncbi:MAG: phospholipase D-like domain-containing protein [Candidatus Woesearchaeota archaeon]